MPKNSIALKYGTGGEEPDAIKLFRAKIESANLSDTVKFRLKNTLVDFLLFSLSEKIRSGESDGQETFEVRTGSKKQFGYCLAIGNIFHELGYEFFGYNFVGNRKNITQMWISADGELASVSEYNEKDDLIVAVHRRFLQEWFLHRIQPAVKRLVFFSEDRINDNVAILENKDRKIISAICEYFNVSSDKARALLNGIGDDPEGFIGKLPVHHGSLIPLARYAERPKGQDAIGFYEKHWSKNLTDGFLFKEDLDVADPRLIDAVLNRCKFLAKSRTEPPSAFYPSAFPPPRRPASARPAALQKKLEGNRRRQAAHRAKQKSPQP